MAANKTKQVIISPQAKQDIEVVLAYLKDNWHQKVIDDFLNKLETFYIIISRNPHVFGYYSKSRNIRNYAITNQHVIYYRNKRKTVEIITLFDTRQSPKKLKPLLAKPK
jgi:plasmid stabilization system protein ParE